MKTRLLKPVLSPLEIGLMATTGLVAITILLASTLSANAAIKCNGQFQVVRGNGEISTPWCEDNYLATIARAYGWKVSNRAIRQNPNLKARVCRSVGHDSRLVEICSGYRSDNSRNGWSN